MPEGRALRQNLLSGQAPDVPAAGFPGDPQPALRGHLAQVVQLGFGMLIEGGNSQVQGGQPV